MSFKSEAELAAHIVRWLREHGWTVYQEVQRKTYDKVADIVAKKDSEVWIIETKLACGLTVIEQAYRWNGSADFISVGVPPGRYGFVNMVLHKFGLGRLSVSESGEIFEEVRPERNEIKSGKLVDALTQARLEYDAEAGNNSSDRWTPFRQTLRNVEDEVVEHPGITMKDLLARIQTHYSSKSTASQCIRKAIEDGLIPNVYLHYGPPHRLFLMNQPIESQPSLEVA